MTPKKELATLLLERQEVATARAAARQEVDRLKGKLAQVARDAAAFKKLDAGRTEAAREVERLELRETQLEAEIGELERAIAESEHALAIEKAKRRVRLAEQAAETAARAFQRALKDLVVAGEELKHHRSLVSDAIAAARELGIEPESVDEHDWLSDFAGLGPPLDPHEAAGGAVLVPGPRDRYDLAEIEKLLAMRPDQSRLRMAEASAKEEASREKVIQDAVSARIQGRPGPGLVGGEAEEADRRYWAFVQDYLAKKSPAGQQQYLHHQTKAWRREYAQKVAGAITVLPNPELHSPHAAGARS